MIEREIRLATALFSFVLISGRDTELYVLELNKSHAIKPQKKYGTSGLGSSMDFII